MADLLWPEKIDPDELRRLREEYSMDGTPEEVFRREYQCDWPVEYPDPKCPHCQGKGYIKSHGRREGDSVITRRCTCLRPKP